MSKGESVAQGGDQPKTRAQQIPTQSGDSLSKGAQLKMRIVQGVRGLIGGTLLTAGVTEAKTSESSNKDRDPIPIETESEPSRRKFLKRAAAVTGGVTLLGPKAIAMAADDPNPQNGATETDTFLEDATTNQYFGPVSPTLKLTSTAEEFTAWKERVKTEVNNAYITANIEVDDTPPPLDAAGPQTFTKEEGLQAWNIYEEEIAVMNTEIKDLAWGQNVLYVMTDEAEQSLKDTHGGTIDEQYISKKIEHANQSTKTVYQSMNINFSIDSPTELITLQDPDMNALDTRANKLAGVKVNHETIQLINEKMKDPQSALRQQLDEEAIKNGWEKGNYHVVVLTQHGESVGKTNYVQSQENTTPRGIVIASFLMDPVPGNDIGKTVAMEHFKSYLYIDDTDVEIPLRSRVIPVADARSEAGISDDWYPIPNEGEENMGTWSHGPNIQNLATICHNGASQGHMLTLSSHKRQRQQRWKNNITGEIVTKPLTIGVDGDDPHKAEETSHLGQRFNISQTLEKVASTPKEITVGLQDFENGGEYSNNSVIPDIQIFKEFNGAYRIPLYDINQQLLGDSNGTHEEIGHFNIDQRSLPSEVQFVEEGGEAYLEIPSLDPFMGNPSFFVTVNGYNDQHPTIATDPTLIRLKLFDSRGIPVSVDDDLKQNTQPNIHPQQITSYLKINRPDELQRIDITLINGQRITSIDNLSGNVDLSFLQTNMYIVTPVYKDSRRNRRGNGVKVIKQ